MQSPEPLVASMEAVALAHFSVGGVRYSMAPMSRGHIVFGDIEGKLDVLHVECTKCGGGGRHGVARLSTAARAT